MLCNIKTNQTMKNLFKFLIVAIAFISLSFVKNENKVINVVIDSGHGGHDFGATIDELNEKNLITEITKKIKALHSDSEVVFHYTRTEDSFMDLKDRANFINQIKPDLAISLHVNHTKNTDANGFEIFVSDENIQYEKSKVFADKLLEKFSKTPLKIRGVKKGSLMVLRNSEYPSMVVELGFISNASDRKYITSENGQTEIAQTILDFASDLK
jgi:N-acetylmuramoyl-L-alanine amidase